MTIGWRIALGFSVLGSACTHAPAPAQRAHANPSGEPAVSHEASPLQRASTPRNEVVETLHGQEIEDPYRWLEDESDAVHRWVESQNQLAERTLHALPNFDAIFARVESLAISGEVTRPTVTHSKGGYRYFYERRSGRQDQSILLARDSLEGPDLIVVDPNRMSDDGTISLDWYQPSLEGGHVAYGTSVGGSEWSTLRVRNVETGRDLDETVERARSADICWEPGATGFYYTRYPAIDTVPPEEASYHRRVYYHRLHSPPEVDPLIFGAGRDMTEWPTCELSPDGRWLVITVYQGWNQSEVFVADTRREPLQFERATEGRPNLYHSIVRNNAVFVMTDEGAERFRVLKFSPREPARKNWKELIAEHPTDVIRDVTLVGGEVLVSYLHDAASRLVRFDSHGKVVGDIALPELGTSSGFSGHFDGSEAFFEFESFGSPTSIRRLDLKTGRSSVWERIEPPSKRVSITTTRATATSKDGTHVPYFVVRRNDDAHQARPTVLYGYGGFNISLTPRYLRSIQILLEAGGVYAQAVLRGGGEYGSKWHEAGQLENKQNVFDDFFAVSEALVTSGVAERNRLGIWGRSNGGLLVAAAITQHPEMFRAAVAGVPLTDMLRYDRFLVARLWIPEYGSAQNAEQFPFLYAYSPYHHVRPRTPYPAVLLTTAANDSRVHPMHARKMAAALQYASSSSYPVLLRSETEAGHGAGKALHQRIVEHAEDYAFFISELGLAWNEPELRGEAP